MSNSLGSGALNCPLEKIIIIKSKIEDGDDRKIKTHSKRNKLAKHINAVGRFFERIIGGIIFFLSLYDFC